MYVCMYVCLCIGFYGPACTDTTDSKDRHSFTHDGPFFSGSVVRVAAHRLESNEFSLFSAHIAPPPSPSSPVDIDKYIYENTSLVTAITGGRELIHNGDMSLYGSAQMFIPHGGTTNVLTLNYGILAGISGSSSSSSSSRNDGPYHIQALSYDNDVFTVDLHGAVTANSLNIGNDTLIAEPNGLVAVDNLKVKGALDVMGGVNLADSLTIGSGFALTPGGMTVDVESHMGTLFELRSSLIPSPLSLSLTSSLISSLTSLLTSFLSNIGPDSLNLMAPY